MTIVADVFTDLNSQMALEEALGYPMQFYMICPVDGEPVVCVGAVYSYHEFKQPISNRLTNEQWRNMLKKRKYPARETWTQSYIVENTP